SCAVDISEVGHIENHVAAVGHRRLDRGLEPLCVAQVHLARNIHHQALLPFFGLDLEEVGVASGKGQVPTDVREHLCILGKVIQELGTAAPLVHCLAYLPASAHRAISRDQQHPAQEPILCCPPL